MVKKKVRVENMVVIKVSDHGANDYFMDAHFTLTKHDEVILSTKHLRWLLNRVVDKLVTGGNKDPAHKIHLCNEVERWMSDEDELCVKLRVIGAVR